MAEFPALNLWTDAYLADTRHLSTLEHGAYLLLLIEAWRRPNCDLPDDDRMLSRLAGLSQDEWLEIKPIVMGFWTFDGRSKTWKQKRLMFERDAARKRSTSQRDKAAKRWDKTKKTDAAALPKSCRNDASTTTTTTTTYPVETNVSTVAGATAGAEEGQGSFFPDDDPPQDDTPIEPEDEHAGSAAEMKRAVFNSAKRLLTSAGHRNPGAIVTKWRQTYPDHVMLDVLARAEGEQPEDPIAWITAALRNATRRQNGGQRNDLPQPDNRDGALRYMHSRMGLGEAPQPARTSGRWDD
jgi:uncharacterized protein YdaU (DUF1376 family)